MHRKSKITAQTSDQKKTYEYSFEKNCNLQRFAYSGSSIASQLRYRQAPGVLFGAHASKTLTPSGP